MTREFQSENYMKKVHPNADRIVQQSESDPISQEIRMKNDISVTEQQYPQSHQILIENLRFKADRYGKLGSAQEQDVRDLINFCVEFAFTTAAAPTERQKKDFMFRVRSVPKEEVCAWYTIRNKRTAYCLKACLKAVMISGVSESINLLVRLKSSVGPVRARYLQGIRRHVMAIRTARAHGVFDKRDRSSEGRWVEYHRANLSQKKATGKPDKTKRNTTNKLPSGWIEELAKAMKYDPTLDLLIATGLRAIEINSAKMSVDKDGLLVVNIKSAKTPKGNPPRFRNITLNPNTPSAARLFAKRDSIDFSRVETGPFRLRLGNISRRLFKVRVSPKVFRHELAAVIKRIDGPTGTRISVILGQSSSRTSCGYGPVRGKRRHSQTDNLDPVVYATSSEPVRETRSMTYRHHEKKASKVDTENKIKTPMQITGPIKMDR